MVRTLRAQAAVEEVREAEVEVEAYRRYTEAMLRRFGKLKMEAGRTPSLLGREMFRGKVTHYKVSGFDDVVIFCHDVEGCLAGLGMRQQMLLRKIGVQRYTQAEAAATMGLSLRHAVRLYWAALDDLTRVFLERRLLERLQ